MRIGKKNLNTGVYLIAEAGSNHNGDYRTAKRLVTAAAEAGADAVKFQLFSLDSLIAADAFERVLGIPDSSWRTGFRKLEFPLPWLPRLMRVAGRAGIDLLCTPFDLDRLEYYLGFDPPAVKIASGDLTFRKLLAGAGRSGKPVILSTGAGTDEEVREALRETGCRTVLLDCVMRYPASPESYGLERMLALAGVFGCPVGLSDHTESPALAVVQVMYGACVVEKHFTLDRSQNGADHAMSTDPDGFRVLAAALRDAVSLRKPGRKRRGDEKERKYARRSVYARREIQPGDVLDEFNTIPLRPAVPGVPVGEWDRILGKKSGKRYVAGEAIRR